MDHSAGIAQTVTVPGVELVQAGIWAATTGVTNVTADHLAAMVAASRDPGVERAPIKLGHVDPRFDGEPAKGWAENLRVEQRPELGPDEQPTGRLVPTLVADLAGVPKGLAAIMPTAYRRRSVEIGWGYKTAAGAKYSAALTGLALLGVTPPAVKSLADVLAMYAAGSSSHVVDSSTVLSTDPAAARRALAAALLAGDPNTPPPAAGDGLLEIAYRSLLQPQEVPTVDENRLRTLLGIQANGDIEQAVASLVAAGGQPAAAPAAAPGTPAAAPAAAGPAQQYPGYVLVPGVGYVAAAPQASTPAAPVAGPAAAGPVAPTAAAPAAPTPAPGTGPAPAAVAPPPVGLPDGVALPPGMALVSEAVLNELRGGVQAGVAAAQVLAEQSTDRELAAALSAGKITPAEYPQWRANMLNPASGPQTRALLTAMQPRFSTPQTMLGSGSDTAPAAVEVAWDNFERNVLGIDPGPPAGWAPAGYPQPAYGQPAPAPAAMPQPAMFAAGQPGQPVYLPPGTYPPQPAPPMGYSAVNGWVPMPQGA